MFDRLLLRMYSFVVAFTAVWAALWLLGVSYVVGITHSAVMDHWMWVYVIAIFLLSIRYVFFRLQSRQIHSFVKSTDSGEIRIGYAAVNELARRSAAQIRGVTKLQTRVDESPEGLVVWLRVRAEAGVDLTGLSEQMQQVVMEAIRSATSLTVSSVHVQVADLAPIGSAVK